VKAAIATELKDDNAFLFRSDGADGLAGSADDIVCLTVFRRELEDDRMVWQKYREWTVPEGLDAILDDFYDPRGDKRAVAQVVAP
jgi:hypothetical protein